MLSKFLDIKENIFRDEKVDLEVNNLLDTLLEDPKMEEIVILKGLVNLSDDESLKLKISRIVNLIKFPLKKVMQ